MPAAPDSHAQGEGDALGEGTGSPEGQHYTGVLQTGGDKCKLGSPCFLLGLAVGLVRAS